MEQVKPRKLTYIIGVTVTIVVLAGLAVGLVYLFKWKSGPEVENVENVEHKIIR